METKGERSLMAAVLLFSLAIAFFANITGALVPAVYETTLKNSTGGETALQLLNGMNASFVFRGFFQWGRGDLQPGFYSSLAQNIVQLKQAIPGLTYEGGIGVQFLAPNNTWANGTQVSTQDFNSMAARNASGGIFIWTSTPAHGVVPDLASPLFREYLIGWSEKQIDAGVDGMFFDGPYVYAQYKISAMHQNPTTVYGEYSGYLFKDVIGAIRNYSISKGKKFFAAVNGGICDKTMPTYARYPITLQSSDYIHCSFEEKDFEPSVNPSLSLTENFTKIRSYIRSFTNVPIILFFDWPGQMNLFENLTTQQQITIIKNTETTTKAHGLYFAYPVYLDALQYDSVSYGTYGTIVQLAGGSGLQTTLPATVSTSTTSIPQTTTIVPSQTGGGGNAPYIEIVIALIIVGYLTARFLMRKEIKQKR